MAVQAVLDESISPRSQPGAFKYFVGEDPDQVEGMVFLCPCGCGDFGTLNFDPLQPNRPCWQWDGNRERPTLHPSVRKVGTCTWHGWLRAGQWEEA